MFLQKMVQLSNQAFLQANKKKGLEEKHEGMLYLCSVLNQGCGAAAADLTLVFSGWKWRESSAWSDRKRKVLATGKILR